MKTILITFFIIMCWVFFKTQFFDIKENKEEVNEINKQILEYVDNLNIDAFEKIEHNIKKYKIIKKEDLEYITYSKPEDFELKKSTKIIAPWEYNIFWKIENKTLEIDLPKSTDEVYLNIIKNTDIKNNIQEAINIKKWKVYINIWEKIHFSLLNDNNKNVISSKWDLVITWPWTIHILTKGWIWINSEKYLKLDNLYFRLQTDENSGIIAKWVLWIGSQLDILTNYNSIQTEKNITFERSDVKIKSENKYWLLAFWDIMVDWELSVDSKSGIQWNNIVIKSWNTFINSFYYWIRNKNNNSKFTIDGWANVVIESSGIDLRKSINIKNGSLVLFTEKNNNINDNFLNNMFNISNWELIVFSNWRTNQSNSTLSKQNFINIKLKESQKSNSKFTIKNSIGEVVMEMVSPKDYDNIAFSNKKLIKDQTYFYYSDNNFLWDFNLKDETTNKIIENNSNELITENTNNLKWKEIKEQIIEAKVVWEISKLIE